MRRYPHLGPTITKSLATPLIVVVNSNCRIGILIDVAIPADINIVGKESEKNIKICVLSYKDFGT